MRTRKKIYNTNYTRRNINSLNNIYKKSYNENTNEFRLACYLANNNKIKLFAFNIFYFILNYWKKNYPKNWTIIIKDFLIEKLDDKIILEIGFTEYEYYTIIQFVKNSDYETFFIYLSDKFYKVTACLNNLSKPDFIIYHVNINKDLQNIFIKELHNLLLIDNVKWIDIKDIYDSLKTKSDKNMYNFFIFDLIYGSEKSVNSIYRSNLFNLNFFREKLINYNHNKNNLIKLNECNKSIINNKNYMDYYIYNSTERYNVNKSSPYAKLMNLEKKTYIGGPSGSTAIMYITLFQFYKYPFTYKNKVLLLATLVADYIPLWHTIPEILLSAISEFKDKQLPKYNLNMNPVLYCIKLFSSINI
jgi:hypothetical protein